MSQIEVQKIQIISFRSTLNKNKLVSFWSAYVFWAGALKAQFNFLFKLNSILRKWRRILGIRESIRVTWSPKLQG